MIHLFGVSYTNCGRFVTRKTMKPIPKKFLLSFFLLLEKKRKGRRGRNNRRALGLARNDEDGGRDGS